MRKFETFCHVLPVPQRAFHAPLYVTNVGIEHIQPGQVYPELKPAVYFFSWEEGRTLPEFCLALCVGGAGTLETRKGRQALHAGEAFLFRPGEWHRHRPVKAVGWSLCWFGFNGDLPHRWMNEDAFAMDGNKPVIEFRELFEQQFERMLLITHRAPTRNSEELAWQAIGLLSHFVIDRHAESAVPEHRSKDVVGLAVEFIWNHTHTGLSVADVVRHVGCSRRTLESRFKLSMEKTVLDEILTCCTERALHLLKSTNLPIKQIVLRSGFQSREQMRLVFHKLLGKAPRDFRSESKSRSRG